MPKRKKGEHGAEASQSALAVEAGPASAGVEHKAGARQVLPEFNTLDKLVDALRRCKRIVVLTGAGISVSCGIPDFRSENGVYEVASRLDLGLSCPEDLFDLEFFIDDPEPFFKFAKALYPGSYVPSPTHRFLKALESRGKLLRNFTQNIDGLEAQVGLKKYIACHGSFLTATCLSCKKKRTAEDIREDVMQQKVPACPACKRGVMKPDITFFGEKLPNNVKRAVEADYKKADLLLVLGTSLKVQPVSRILQFIPPHVPQVLVNRELVRPPRTVSDGFDLHLLGDCDDVIQHLCARLGWELPPLPEPSTPCPSATPTGTPGDAEAGEKAAAPQAGIVPSFTPPNSYVFSSSGGGGGGGSRAWAALGGGVEEKVAGVSNGSGGVAEDNDFEEVVTCDGCDEVVTSEVYACNECFGFDLCRACHGDGRNGHSRTTGHSFRTERAPASRTIAPVDSYALPHPPTPPLKNVPGMISET